MAAPSHVFLILSLLFGTIAPDRILLLPAQHLSHVMEQVVVGETLVQRGHIVLVLLDSNFPKIREIAKLGIKPVIYKEPAGAPTFLTKHNEYMSIVFDGPYDRQARFNEVMEVNSDVCGRILHNKPLLKRLTSLKLDLVVTDGFLLQPCLFLIPHTLELPFIYMFSSPAELGVGNPSLPSFTPSFMIEDQSLPMTLWERMRNVFLHWKEWNLIHSAVTSQMMSEFAPEYSSIWEIIRKSELFIKTRDHILEWPTTSLPNLVLVPGITVRPVEPLPENLQKILDASEQVAVMSFGSSVGNIPKDTLYKLFQALRQMQKTTFVVRASNWSVSAIKSFPKNIIPMEWLPQQDILAHPKTRLFITHCGNNGQYESIYHGVPMIGFPLHAEQHHNCRRIEKRNLGVCLNIHDFTPHDLLITMRSVVADDQINAKVKKLSRVLKSQPFSKDIVASKIEHVLHFRGDHLRSPSQEMPIHQLLMLDLLAVIIVSLICIPLLLYYCYKMLMKIVLSKNKIKVD